MKFQVTIAFVDKVEADLIAVFSTTAIDKALGGLLSEVAKEEGFEGKNGDTLLIHSHGKIAAKRIFLVGLGKVDKLSVFDLQTLAAIIGRKAKSVGAKKVVIAIPQELNKFDASVLAQSFTEGIKLGVYSFIKHKSKQFQKKEKIIDAVEFLVDEKDLKLTQAGISLGLVTSDAVIFARDLVNEPPSVTTPTYLGQVAMKLARQHKEITVEVLSPDEMKSLGMEALLGIARGSDEEPRFIKLEYNPSGKITVALVGKGITFDTGGLSLKTGEGMETMKLDMAGGAAVLAVFSALPKLMPNVRVVGLICATENMPGPKAIKPGDIVTAMNGETIEILNTDAEGRVVLADALSYAGIKVKPDIIIDLATLTGACMVALGEDVSGLFSNNEKLANELKKSARATGERIWELPLVAEYKEKLKSTVADIKNITGGKYGGAITGALFLEEFVPEKTPWAHLDIAGPSFAEKDAFLTPHGGTGVGVRLLLSYLKSLKDN